MKSRHDLEHQITNLEAQAADIAVELTELRSALADLPPEPPKPPAMWSGQVWRDSHGRLGVVVTDVGHGVTRWGTFVPFSGGRAIDWEHAGLAHDPGDRDRAKPKSRYGLAPATFVAATLDEFLAHNGGAYPW